MAQSPTASGSSLPLPQLRFFITYAREDHPAAIALCNALTALDDTFAQVFLDTEGLRAGFDFSQQIRDRLDQTDVLIIVYTGRSKSSHSWTGLEVGYFMRVIKESRLFTHVKTDGPDEGRERRIVSFYLTSPPPATPNIQGIAFDISNDDLALTEDQYAQKVDDINSSNPMVVFFRQMEREVDSIRRSAGAPEKTRDIRELLSRVRNMLMAIFTHLKHSIDIDVNPQKKIILEVPGNLDPEAMELPGDAQLIVPPGTGAMEIFGLPSTQLSWSEFLNKAPDKYRFTWKDVIETVVISSVPDRLDVDNSQIIVARSGSEIYRVVLSRSVRYFDGRREFHLYFVESLQRGNYGNRLTTLMLKGLELACRLRFLFFERSSEFSSANLSLVVDTKIKETARNLIKELNLLQRDSTAARLDEPLFWTELVDFTLLRKTVDAYYPIEADIRKAAAAIIKEPQPTPRLELLNAVQRLEKVVGPLNLMFIAGLGEKLKHIDVLDRFHK